jgi:hypothetical protein
MAFVAMLFKNRLDFMLKANLSKRGRNACNPCNHELESEREPSGIHASMCLAATVLNQQGRGNGPCADFTPNSKTREGQYPSDTWLNNR